MVNMQIQYFKTLDLRCVVMDDGLKLDSMGSYCAVWQEKEADGEVLIPDVLHTDALAILLGKQSITITGDFFFVQIISLYIFRK